MFDLPLPIYPTAYTQGVPPHFPSGETDPNHPFALTLSRRAPADQLSGRAVPLVIYRFATLADAIQGAIDHAEAMTKDAAFQLLAILDRDEGLVLAGAASDHAVAWCHPVTSAVEARGMVTEASQLHVQAGRAVPGVSPIWRLGCASVPIFWMRVSSIRSSAVSTPGRCRSRRAAADCGCQKDRDRGASRSGPVALPPA